MGDNCHHRCISRLPNLAGRFFSFAAAAISISFFAFFCHDSFLLLNSPSPLLFFSFHPLLLFRNPILFLSLSPSHIPACAFLQPLFRRIFHEKKKKKERITKKSRGFHVLTSPPSSCNISSHRGSSDKTLFLETFFLAVQSPFLKKPKRRPIIMPWVPLSFWAAFPRIRNYLVDWRREEGLGCHSDKICPSVFLVF